MNKHKAIALVGGSFAMGLLAGAVVKQFLARGDLDYATWRKEKRINAVCKNCEGCTKEVCPVFKNCEGCYRENPCAECMQDFCDECQAGRTPEEITKANEPETTEGEPEEQEDN